MGFFSNWKSSSGNDEGFMVDFLNKSAESVLEIENGDEDEINNACEVLSQINVNKMIEILLTLDTQRNVLPAEIPQYSSFLDGVCKLPELIEDETNGVGFEKIGLLLAGSAKKGACVKYGENHSKLASIFGLVSISTTKPKMVKITRLGKKLINYSLEQKKTILQMLLLREYIVKKMISEASKGEVFYRGIAGSLKASTADRRRNNTKYLVEFVLKGSEYQDLLLNMDWFGW